MSVNVRVYPPSAVLQRDARAFFGDVRMVSGPLADILRRAAERGASALYDSDFCGSVSFADWWYHYACELDLPLIRSIDDPGLVVSGVALEQLERELDRLEKCWAGQDLSHEPSHGQMSLQPGGSYRTEEISHAEYLRQAAAIMRDAIAIARAQGAVLVAG